MHTFYYSWDFLLSLLESHHVKVSIKPYSDYQPPLSHSGEAKNQREHDTLRKQSPDPDHQALVLVPSCSHYLDPA